MNQLQTPQYPYCPETPAAPRFVPAYARKRPVDPEIDAASRTFNRLCLVVLLQTAAAFVFELPLTMLSAVMSIDLTDALAYQLLLAAMVPLSTALPFFLYLKIGRKDVTEYLRFEKVGFGRALLCVSAGLAVCLLANFPAIAVQDFFGRFGYESIPQVAGEDSLLLFFLELLSTAVLVPVMEEFAFRGVLCSALRRYGSGFAVVASALVFSLVHMDFANVVFALIAGLVFGFLYVRTGNLWITIAIHALNNGLAVIGTYEEFLFGPAAELIDILLMIVPVALGLLALTLLLLRERFAFFRLDPPYFSAGNSISAIVRAPLFWVIVLMMIAYTVGLFL